MVTASLSDPSECRRFETCLGALGKFVYPIFPVFQMKQGKRCWSLLYGVYDGGRKNVYRNLFSQQDVFFYQVLFSRMLPELAIYLQNDLNFSLISGYIVCVYRHESESE